MQKQILLIIAFIFGQLFVQGQEFHFKFKVQSKDELNSVTKIISIDNVHENWVEAYANKAEMLQFTSLGYPYELIQDAAPKVLNMATTLAQMASWDRYPTYEVYVEMMQNFAANYPAICQLEEIGTLSSGRKLLALKISDNVTANNEAEPELLYTGTMHGDETTGFILLLRLADYLLSHYGDAAYPEVNNLVNNAEIWINPASNPNGTYAGGNSSLSGATRYNAQSIDLNRNFPNPGGSNPTTTGRAHETAMMMNFATNHHFTLSANFHGGAEVLNYPWDYWSRLPADNAWWVYVCRNYANTVHANSIAGYLTYLDNGITNGYAWYSVDGGRQDYMNYYHHCREVTMEISNTKLLSTDQLVNHWNYNRQALLNYLTEGLYGVRGVVTNAQGQPLAAKVEVLNHEADNSWVETDARAGDYARYLKAGTYSIKFSAEGYVDKTITNVVVTDGAATFLNVVLALPQPYLMVENAAIDTAVIKDKVLFDTILLSNAGGAPLNYALAVENDIQHPWISLSQTSGTLQYGQTLPVKVTLDATGLLEQTYNANLQITGDSNVTIPVTMRVYTTPELSLNQVSFSQSILTNQTAVDTLIIKNIGNSNLSYSLSIDTVTQSSWLTLDKTSGELSPGSSEKVILSYAPQRAGNFSAQIIMEGSFHRTISVSLLADTLPFARLFADSLVFNQLITDSITSSFMLENQGGSWLNYHMTNTLTQIFSLPAPQGGLGKGQQTTVPLMVNANKVSKGRYADTIVITSEYDTAMMPLVLYVDTLPKLAMLNPVEPYQVVRGYSIKDTLVIENMGGSVLNYAPALLDSTQVNWISIQTGSASLSGGQRANLIFSIDATMLDTGDYRATITLNDPDSNRFDVVLSVIEKPELAINILSVVKTVQYKESRYDTILLSNLGGGILSYSLNILENNPLWFSVNKQAGTIGAYGYDTLILYFNGSNLTSGLYETKLEIISSNITKIPVKYTMLEAPQILLSASNVSIFLNQGADTTVTFNLKNIGASTLNYHLSIANGTNWLTIKDDQNGFLMSLEEKEVALHIETGGLNPGNFQGNVMLASILGNDTLQTETFAVNLDVITGIAAAPSALNGIYPNPFSTETLIKVPSEVSSYNVFIYNSIGICVFETKVTGNPLSNGVIWNGTDQQNQAVPAGLYLVSVVGEHYKFTGKVYKK